MSVLIKDMQMPKSCSECRFFRDTWCYAFKADDWRNAYNKPPEGERLNNCPLVSIPLHGKLIDATEISKHKYTTIPSYRKEYADGKPKSDEEIIAFKFGWNYAIDAIIENAPIIIGVEEDEK